MDILYTQPIQVLVAYLVIYIGYRRYASTEVKDEARKNKPFIFILGFAILIFVAIPVKKTVPDRTSVETEPAFVVPKKVEVEEKTFKDKQKAELEALRKENKENEDIL